MAEGARGAILCELVGRSVGRLRRWGQAMAVFRFLAHEDDDDGEEEGEEEEEKKMKGD